MQVVFVLAGDADGVALDLGADLCQAIADQLGDRAGQVLVDALAQLGGLADRAAGGLLDLAEVENLG